MSLFLLLITNALGAAPVPTGVRVEGLVQTQVYEDRTQILVRAREASADKIGYPYEIKSAEIWVRIPGSPERRFIASSGLLSFDRKTAFFRGWAEVPVAPNAPLFTQRPSEVFLDLDRREMRNRDGFYLALRPAT